MNGHVLMLLELGRAIICLCSRSVLWKIAMREASRVSQYTQLSGVQRRSGDRSCSRMLICFRLRLVCLVQTKEPKMSISRVVSPKLSLFPCLQLISDTKQEHIMRRRLRRPEVSLNRVHRFIAFFYFAVRLISWTS